MLQAIRPADIKNPIMLAAIIFAPIMVEGNITMATPMATTESSRAAFEIWNRVFIRYRKEKPLLFQEGFGFRALPLPR
jgi:hypothetical protein